MQNLNFFPYYEPLLARREKTTTFRLHRPTFQVGDRCVLTVGWQETDAKQLHEVHVRAIYEKKLKDLSADDFRGESPDCQSVEASQLVLGAIYRQVVSAEDSVWVVKFEHF